jgi:hypothetical protein
VSGGAGARAGVSRADSLGRRPMVAFTYAVSGLLLAATGYAFAYGSISASNPHLGLVPPQQARLVGPHRLTHARATVRAKQRRPLAATPSSELETDTAPFAARSGSSTASAACLPASTCSARVALSRGPSRSSCAGQPCRPSLATRARGAHRSTSAFS